MDHVIANSTGGAFDLPAYLRRIGWDGPLEPTLPTLAALLNAHTLSVPFENLDVLLARPIRLDLASLQQKIVGARRGGYCFEHTTVFRAALEAIGFSPVSHTARVVVATPRESAPRTHMFLTVPLPEGTFIVDPGFGGHGARVPVRVEENVLARRQSDVHYLRRDGGEWVLTTEIAAAPVSLWQSTLERECPIDFEMGNHFTSTFPNSRFVNNLLLQSLLPNGRVSVMNEDVTIARGADVEKRRLADRADLRRLLIDYFGFDLPEVERLRVPAIPAWA